MSEALFSDPLVGGAGGGFFSALGGPGAWMKAQAIRISI
jgi:hypothetical protein